MTLPFFVVYLYRIRGIDLELAAIALSVLAAAGFVGNPLGGSLSDRIGARPTLIIGLVIAAVGTGSVTLVGEAWHGLAAAGVIGLGASIIWPAQDTLLATLVPTRHRSRVFSVRHATMNAGFGIGAFIAATIVDIESPRSFVTIYLVDAASYLAFIPVLVSLRLPSPDVQPATRAAADPGYRAVLRDPVFRRVWLLTVLLVMVGMSQLHASFPAYATGPGGIGAGSLAIAIAANSTGVVVLQLFVLRSMEGRRRTTGILLVGLAWAAAWAITLGTGQLGGGGVAVAGFSLAMVVFALGETFMSPTLPAMVNDLASDELRGRYNGLYTLAWTTGFLTGPILAGVFLGSGRTEILFTVLICGCVVAGIGGIRLRRLITDKIDRIVSDEDGPLDVVPPLPPSAPVGNPT